MLTSLNLSECSGIVALGQLSVLRGLDMLYCGGLLQLPDSLGRLSALTSLNLRECSGLRQLPTSLGRLSALTSLQIGDSLISKRVY